MTKEKTIVFDATVRDVFNLTLKQIPNLRPLLDEMAKLTPANRRSYKALLHVVATEHNLRTAKTGEQQKLALPEPARPQVRTPSKAENWATFTREFSEEILRADKMNQEPWFVPTVIWRNGLLGLTVGVQTRDGEVNTFGSQMACKTQLLYLTQHRKNKGTWVEAKAALPTSRTEFWDEELLPLYGGGPVNQPDRPRDEYEDNQWILLRPTEVAHPMYFRTVVHATKLDQDLLELSRYWRIDRLTLTSIEAHEYGWWVRHAHQK